MPQTAFTKIKYFLTVKISSMGTKNAFQTVLHGAVTFVYFYTILEYQRLPPMPHKKDHEHFAGCWKFLTFWNLVITIILQFLICNCNF